MRVKDHLLALAHVGPGEHHPAVAKPDNPVNPHGHRTSYLWDEIWQPDSLLEIVGRYIVPTRDGKKKLTGAIFPRFHQLDATRRLRAQVLEEGPGGRYLIQHSAGSGKTNSIAWTAHFLAARLRGCRPVCLAEDPSLRQRAAALWKDVVGSGPDVATQTDAVVVLTPQCLRALATPSELTPARIEALSARHPGITVAALLTRDGVPRLLSMDRLKEFVQSRLKEEVITVELDAADQNDHPDPGVH